MDNEDGYIVVETIGTFVPFVLLVVSILSLVNIITVQARVHYALTQAANSLSVYCYTLEVLGIANELTTLSGKAERVAGEANAMKGDINGALSGISSISGLFDAVASGGRVVSRAFDWGEEIVGDPKAALQLLMDYGVNELRGKVFEELVRPLVGRYLASGEKTGDEFLKRAKVVNKNTGTEGLAALEFYRFSNIGLRNSALIDSEGNVKLVVEYEIEYTFGALPLPFRPTLRVSQTAVTKAWLNGSGKGYK